MRFLLVLAAILVAAIGPAFAQGGDGVAVVPDISAAGRFDLMAEVGKRYGQTLEVIKSEFPDDYAVLMANIAGLSWQGGEENRALLGAFGILTELKKKYASRLPFAPSRNHTGMLGSLAKFYVAYPTARERSVRPVRARQVGRAVRAGAFGQVRGGARRAVRRLFRGRCRGHRDAGIQRRRAAGDWSAVMNAMLAAGRPQSFVKTISEGNRADPDLCPALSAMFVTSGVLDTPEGRRTRRSRAEPRGY